MDWRRTDRQVCAALHAPPATWLGAGSTTFDGCMFSAQRNETKRRCRMSPHLWFFPQHPGAANAAPRCTPCSMGRRHPGYNRITPGQALQQRGAKLGWMHFKQMSTRKLGPVCINCDLAYRRRAFPRTGHSVQNLTLCWIQA